MNKIKSKSGKKHLCALLVILQLAITPKLFSQNIAINTTGNNPDASAMLDITSSTQGFLMPRMTTVQMNAIALPATGLLIFNTTLNVFEVNVGTTTIPNWVPIGTSQTGWATSGNAGTNSGANFLGTSDNHPLVFKVNNTKAGYIDSLGGKNNISFGLNALPVNTTGTSNIAIGQNSLTANTTGNGNIAIGQGSLNTNNTGFYNDALGFQSLYSNTTGAYNIGIGDSTLWSNTTSNYNLAIGHTALVSNTTGNSNIAVGLNALRSNTTGAFSTAVGVNALYANTTGADNTGIGRQALFANTTGADNAAVGFAALNSNTTGNHNNAFGSLALYNNTTGVSNSAFGYQSLFANTNGNANTGFGYQTLTANTTGFSNTAIGNQTLAANTTGTYNTGTGNQALYSNTTASFNTANGYYSLYSDTSGFSNTATGYYSLYGNTTGWGNTATGIGAGATNVTGTRLTIVGDSADVTGTGLTNATAIGAFAKVAASNSLVLGGTGSNAVNVGIGTTTPAHQLQIVGQAQIDTLTSGSLNDSIVTVTASGTPGGVLHKLSSSSLIKNTAWSLTGNTGTNSGANFLGTTDNHSLKFKVNNTLAGFIDSSAISGNTFLGNSAGIANTGTRNTAVGALAMLSNTTGTSNVAIGVNAFNSNVGGSNVTAIGTGAMQYANNAAGTFYSQNTAVGYYALQGSTTPSVNTGSGNTAMGYQALQYNSSGAYNIAIGVNALAGNSSGSNNTAMGYYAGGATAANGGNVYIGYKAGVNATGANNTAIGAQALNGASGATGTNNAFVGTNAGVALTSGSNNVSLGYNTFFDNSSTGLTTGNNNIALGSGSNPKLTTGSDNIAIGYNASPVNVTTGSGNLTIGSSADVPAAGGSNQMNIKNIIFGTGLNGTLATPAGNIGIGTTTPTNTLDVKATTNPLRLEGLQVGTASDSILTFNSGGVVKYQTATAILGNTTWNITGNTGTTAPTVIGSSVGTANFIGTTDSKNVALGTAGKTRMILDTLGNAYGGDGTTSVQTLSGNAISANNSRNFIWGNNNLITSATDANGGARTNALFGANNHVYGDYFGGNTGAQNLVTGNSNNVFGSINFVAGQNNNDSASGSFVTGYKNIVGQNAAYGAAIGQNLTLTQTATQIALGTYNKDTVTAAFVVGAGTSSAANNAITVSNGGSVSSNNGNVGINNVNNPLKRLHINAANSSGAADSLKIDNLATTSSASNKSILVIDSTTGYVSRISPGFTAIRTTNVSTTLTPNDYTLILSGTGAAANYITVTFPQASTCPGRTYVIVNYTATTSGSVTQLAQTMSSYNGTAAELKWNLGNSLATATCSIAPYSAGTNLTNQRMTWQSDGTYWYLIGL